MKQMLTKWPWKVACLLFSTIAPSAMALTPFEDNFDAARMNLKRWQLIPDSPEKIVQENGRLHFKKSSTAELGSYAELLLRNNQPGYNEDWEIVLDVKCKFIPSPNSPKIGVKIFNADDPRDAMSFLFAGNRREDGGFATYYYVDGEHAYIPLIFVNPRTSIGSIRIRYSKQSKMFTLSYDEDGRSNEETSWKPLTTYSVNGVGGYYRGDWKMNKASGRFGVCIRTKCEFDVPLGYVSCDNFVLRAPK